MPTETFVDIDEETVSRGLQGAYSREPKTPSIFSSQLPGAWKCQIFIAMSRLPLLGDEEKFGSENLLLRLIVFWALTLRGDGDVDVDVDFWYG